MENNYKELRKNTIVIAIANIGSRAISFILAPLYSYFLTTDQYGAMDLFITTASLLGPLICFDIYEATFRFAKDETYNNKDVISSSLALCAIETIFWGIMLALVCIFVTPPITTVLCIISVFIDIFLSTMTQYARGCEKIGVFAFSGVINSIVLLLGNLLLLVWLKMGLIGWIMSFIVAKIVAIFYLVIRTKVWRDISTKFIKKTFYREALNYSLPLMPSAMMWWVMNVSDRYVLTFFYTTSITGIYAVASKLPSILSIFENIFYQAWQTSAINSLKNDDKADFYSNIFNSYFRLLCVGVIGLLIFLKPLTLILFAEEYHDAWICSAILLVGVLVHALCGNLGGLYVAFKETKGALKTAVAGALINLILNIFFIPLFGTIAAATTTLVGYLVVLFWRWYDMRKYVKLKINIKQYLFYFVLMMFQLIFYYISGVFSCFVRIAIGVFVLWINRELLVKLIRR